MSEQLSEALDMKLFELEMDIQDIREGLESKKGLGSIKKQLREVQEKLKNLQNG